MSCGRFDRTDVLTRKPPRDILAYISLFLHVLCRRRLYPDITWWKTVTGGKVEQPCFELAVDNEKLQFTRLKIENFEREVGGRS